MQASLFAPINIYCERVSPDFWAEPWNALSNASFLVAAWFAWRLACTKEEDASAIEVKVLASLMAIIGIGSFLFHTFAVRWAMFADVIPISVYQVLFLVFYMRKVAGLASIHVGLWFVAFIGVSVAFGALPGAWLNGSLSYASALIFIAGMGVYHWRAKKQKPWALLAASAIFTASLAFRSIDMAVCNRLSIGTHAVWHLLNGVVLYLTTYAFAVNASNGNSAPKEENYA